MLFFPLPPSAPRIQYLTSFTHVGDLRSLTLSESLNGAFSIGKPFGIYMQSGLLYVTDTQLRNVVVVDLKRREMGLLNDEAEFGQPITITMDRDGKIYIGDSLRMRVYVFDREHSLVGVYGEKVQFRPLGLAIIGSRLFVSDGKDHEIEVFDKDSGAFLFKFGRLGTATGEFNFPGNMASDAQGNLYVIDMLNFRIQKFDADGKFLAQIGNAGDGFGNFARPKGIAIDREGRIFVVDAAFGNVQFFSPDGQLLMYFGGSSNADFSLPAGISISYQGIEEFRQYIAGDFEVEYLIFVVSQFGPKQVYVYGFGHKK